MVDSARVVVNLEEIDHEDKHLVGEHAAHIGGLKSINVSVPAGFVITPSAYFNFLSHNNLNTKIGHLLGSIDFRSESSVSQVAKHIKSLITSSEIPQDLLNEIFSEYKKLGEGKVSVHTSIISGDLEQNNFPREYSFEQIEGDAVLAEILRELWASLFDIPLINYRSKKNIDHLKTGITATVKKSASGGGSGKIYTVDPFLLNKGKMIVEIDGHNHHLVVDKKDKTTTKRRDHRKPTIYVKDGAVVLPPSIGDFEELIKFAQDIENYFYFPQEITWVQNNGKYQILAVKPINLYGNN